MARANLSKSKKVLTSTTTGSKYIPKRPRICINWNPPFQTQIYLVKVPLNVNIVKQDLLHKKQFLKILWSEVWKGGFQMIQILDLLSMYFDAVVVEVRTFLLLFRPKMNNPRWTNFEMNKAGTDNTGMSLGENHVLRIHIVLFISQYYCSPLTLNTRRGGSGMQPQIFPVKEANYIPRSNPNWHEGWYFYLLVFYGSDFVRIFIKKFQTLSEVKIDINLLCKYFSLPIRVRYFIVIRI